MPSIKRAPVRTRLDLTPDYLHVGLQKTGTTFLQKNILPLLEPEIRFVRKSEALILDHEVVTNRPEVIDELGTGEFQGPILMSQEALSGGLLQPDFSTIQNLAAHNPALRVILTLRSQATIIPSMYTQIVKTGYRKSFSQYVEELLASDKLDYASLVEKITGIVGKDRLLVLVFEEFTADPTKAFDHLCGFFSLDKPTPVIVAGPEKVAGSDESLMVRLLCNRLFVAKILGRRMENRVRWVLSAGLRTIAPQLQKRSNRFRLSVQQLETVAARYTPGNTTVLENYGYSAFADAYMIASKAGRAVTLANDNRLGTQ